MGLFRKKKPNLVEEDEWAGFKKAVSSNIVERRIHTRIRYPKMGAIGPLPQIFLQNQEVSPTNMSLGGFLVPTVFPIRPELGKTCDFRIHFKSIPLDIAQKGEFLRAQGERWHVRFLDPGMRLTLEINRAFKSGFIGQNMERVKDEHFPSDPTLVELWLGSSGEAVSFTKSKSSQLNYANNVLKFEDNQFLVGEKVSPEQWVYKDKVPSWLADEIIIFLTNIRHASDNVERLTEKIQKIYY